MSEIDWSKAPEGATHFIPGNGLLSDVFWRIDEDGVGVEAWAVGAMDLVHYKNPTWLYDSGLPKSAIPRPTKTEWADGWPPIGQECEMAYSPSGEGGDLSWRRCRTIGFDAAGDMVAEVVSPKFEYVSAVTPDEFRPIQTPEQRMREELLSIIEDRGYSSHGVADAILSKYNLTEK